MTDPPTASLPLNAPPAAAGRILALDLGTKRVGVAVSDELRLSIRPLPPLGRTNWKKLLLDLKGLVQNLQITAIVLGLPLRLDGSSGEAVNRSEEFARRLRLTFDFPIYFQDERLTSIAAAENLSASGVRGADKQRERLDSEAASIILSDFLAAHERSRKLDPDPG